jgi:nucleoside-diphosphate-sugar epimerase
MLYSLRLSVMMSRDQLFEQPDFLPQLDDLSSLSRARIAVTGHSGVLGRILERRCSSAGLETSLFQGDITEADAVDAWIRDAAPTLIFHFAAKVPVAEVESNPMRAYEVNALGTFHVSASTIRHAPQAWLFLASSSHVYAPLPPGAVTSIAEDHPLGPATFYGVSKLAGEHLAVPILSRCKVATCVGRIFSFSHRTQQPPYLVPSLRLRIAGVPDGGGILRVANPSSVRDILDAETVIDAVLALAQRRCTGILNVGAGRGLTVEAIAQRLADRAGKNVTIEPEGVGIPNTLVADTSRLRVALNAAIISA